MKGAPQTPEELFAAHPVPLAVVHRVRGVLTAWPDVEVRTSRSQVSYRRCRGFAYVWRPGQYLGRPAAPAVLSIALGRTDPSPRFKEVVHPSPMHWLHHLEITTADEVDAEVASWLVEAAGRAG